MAASSYENLHLLTPKQLRERVLELEERVDRDIARIVMLEEEILRWKAAFGETYTRNNSNLTSGSADAAARTPPWASTGA